MIKLRAWNKVKETMMIPRDIQTDWDGNVFYIEATNPNGDFDEGGSDVLDIEQFTGLKDVNGKEIYIGDIVNVWSDVSELTMEPKVNEIVSENLFGNQGVFLKPVGLHLIEPCLYDNLVDKFEVIGNVHKNPEMLEEQK